MQDGYGLLLTRMRSFAPRTRLASVFHTNHRHTHRVGAVALDWCMIQRVEVPLVSSCAWANPFRVATFNILADGLAQTGDFVKVPISCLQWEHRLPMILQEIRAANADIICLQELNHFEAIAAALIKEGYSAFFRAKQPSPALKFGFPADGIGVFYRHSRFTCSPQPAGHCFESVDGQPAAQGFVTAQLCDKQSGRHVLVAATHLKAKAGAENEQTRVHQVGQLLREIEHMLDRHQQLQAQQQTSTSSSQSAALEASGPGSSPAVILCGDLNTTPDSDTVQVLRQHRLQLNSIWDVSWASSSGCSQSASCGSSSNGSSNGSGNPSQADGLGVPGTDQQGGEFTTWKFRSSGAAKRTIDYIWYSEQQLVATSRWRMLSEAEIGPEGLPSPRYPSDHVCVMCQFGWRDA